MRCKLRVRCGRFVNRPYGFCTFVRQNVINLVGTSRPRRSKAFLWEEGGPRSGGRSLPLSQPYRLTAPLTSGAECAVRFAGILCPRRYTFYTIFPKILHGRPMVAPTRCGEFVQNNIGVCREAFCLPFALIKLHLIRHAARDASMFCLQNSVVACDLVLPE